MCLKKYKKPITALIAIAVSSLTGCTITPQKSQVPGMSSVGALNNESVDNHLETKTLMLALQRQLYDALEKIENIRVSEAERGNAMAGTMRFQPGTGTFTGTTKTIQTDVGSISAIVPFSGYTGTKGTPSREKTASTTGETIITRTFQIDPNLRKRVVPTDDEINEARKRAAALGIAYKPQTQITIDPLPSNLNKSLITGSFIEDQLVAEFTSVMGLKGAQSNTIYSPVFTPTNLAISTSFTVVRKGVNGLTFELIPTGDIESIGPSLTATGERTGIYKLEVSFPLIAKDKPGETRRLVQSWFVEEYGGFISVEQQYDQSDFSSLMGRNGYDVSVVNGELVVTRLNEAAKQKMIPEANGEDDKSKALPSSITASPPGY